ncbi:helix-turn-helix domain-containing protein [Nocardioides panacisoli]|uniref:helix-turn-helix domain-containing protein n=1 Tax=Nocardioides panacisoli TaxID=627624 RepID=UPI001C6250D3|nr:helix-turn-helix transcriptional regulator [Nocardioides panacisoli]QYJ03454.1 helix-turn-helix domain-containing protein [Nocardioides panacisoli]
MGELLPMHSGPRNAAPAGTEPLWRELTGEVLRERRHARGERLVETAARAGISTQYLSEVERGRKDPSSEVLAAVAGALDLTLRALAIEVARRLPAAPEPVAPLRHEVGPLRGPLALAA